MKTLTNRDIQAMQVMKTYKVLRCILKNNRYHVILLINGKKYESDNINLTDSVLNAFNLYKLGL